MEPPFVYKDLSKNKLLLPVKMYDCFHSDQNLIVTK